MNRNRCTLPESVPRAKCISGNQFTCHSFLTNCTLLPPENRFSIGDNQLSAHCRFDNDRTNWDVTVRSQCSCPTIENILIVALRSTSSRAPDPVRDSSYVRARDQSQSDELRTHDSALCDNESPRRDFCRLVRLKPSNCPADTNCSSFKQIIFSTDRFD